jgi:hypothetical protein
MTILDVKAMLDIDRFRKININAHAPEEVYIGDDLTPEHNVEFLKRCARMIPVMNFADYDTGHVYARLERGHWTWRDEQGFAHALQDPDTKAGLEAVAPNKYDPASAKTFEQSDVATDKAHTLGAWGEAAGAA